jgi:hypothetical protein
MTARRPPGCSGAATRVSSSIALLADQADDVGDGELDLAVAELGRVPDQLLLPLRVGQARDADGVLGRQPAHVRQQTGWQAQDAQLLLAAGLRDAQRPLGLAPGRERPAARRLGYLAPGLAPAERRRARDLLADLRPVMAGGGAASPAAPPPESEPPAQTPEPTLAELQELKEKIRQEHPAWYPEFRVTFGHSLRAKIDLELAKLTREQLGLPPATDPDRVRREQRALAFAKTPLWAQAGKVERLRAVSGDLAYWVERPPGRQADPAAEDRPG